jgi:3',5'-cyclic AMP phosphodiesterase CpdA
MCGQEVSVERLISIAGASLVLGACLGNQTGNVSATTNGDVSHPAQRGSPIDALRAACGDGEPTAKASGLLRRSPYVQQITTGSAKVGWAGSSAGDELTITAAAAPPATITIDVADATARAAGGDAQTWASASGLAPDTTYCYTLSATGEPLTAATGFRTAPNADSTEPVRFLALGDSGGGGSDQYALLEQMYEFPYQLMVHTGDIAYGSGTVDQLDRTFFDVYADLLRNVPLFPAPGNHDYETAQAGPYAEAFGLPEQRWYAFDWGPVHFVALDTESDLAAQAAWLDDDLTRSPAAWKIAFLHRPPYSSGEHGSSTGIRDTFGPIFERHGVQVVFAGHDHDYERTVPQNGVTYVVTGGGGIGTRPVGRSGFTAFSEDVIHFVYGEVDGDQLTLHAVDATGVEFDSVVIAQ